MRKFLCIVLAFMIICTYITVVYAEDNTTNHTDSNLTDLQTQQQDLQDQIQQSHEELEEVQSQLSENLQQIEKLDERIRTSENEIEDLNNQVKTLQDEIASIQSQLDVAEKNYEKQKEIMEKRLVAIYESSDIKYIDVLLKSSNISEFLSNYYLITEIASVDKDLLDEVESEKKEIELSKQKLEKNQETLATALQTQTKTATVLQNTKALRENYISRLSDEEKAKQAQIDEMTQQYEAVNNQILELAKQGLDTAYIGGVLAWPVPGYTKITSNYGMRVHPITGQYKLHTGVDISAPIGAEFVAANDGIVTKAVASELQELKFARLDKIYEPNKNEILLGLYLNKKNYAISICIDSQNCRINLTTNSKPNPQVAPSFCMLLRKNLIGLKLKNLITFDLERLVILEFEGFDDVDDIITKKLIVELMGKHCNIILLDEENNIIDSMRHIHHENGFRNIVPHTKYVYPSTEKENFLECSSFDDFSKLVPTTSSLGDLPSIIANLFNGISQTFIKGVIYELGIDTVDSDV